MLVLFDYWVMHLITTTKLQINTNFIKSQLFKPAVWSFVISDLVFICVLLFVFRNLHNNPLYNAHQLAK